MTTGNWRKQRKNKRNKGNRTEGHREKERGGRKKNKMREKD